MLSVRAPCYNTAVMVRQDQRDPLLGRLLAGRYEIQALLGEGSVGVVYHALDRQRQKGVAIKILDAALAQSRDSAWAQRFRNGARAAAQLSGPHTVHILDFGEAPEGLYVVMEFLSGRTLKQELIRLGRLLPERALVILQQVTLALSEAHSLGIIHRSLSADNIFLTDQRGFDFVKVLDYTIAKMDTPGGQAATAAGTAVGNPIYMSPEQIRGATLTPRSDLYSVGVVAFEMLSGQPPFTGRTEMELLAAHLTQAPPPLRGVPDDTAELVLRLLAKEPEQRPASAETVLGVLTHLMGPASDRNAQGLGSVAPPQQPVRPEPPASNMVAEQLTITGSGAQTYGPPPTLPPDTHPSVASTVKLPAVGRITAPDSGLPENRPRSAHAPLGLDHGQQVGAYTLVRKLGEGGMGVVFEAVNRTISRRVAIKFLHVHLAMQPEFAHRFVNEARSVNLITDPGLVQITDFGELPNGAAYIVMEFLQGETLSKRLERAGGRLGVEDAQRLGGQIAASLAAAHRAQIVHRDLKPDKITTVEKALENPLSRERNLGNDRSGSCRPFPSQTAP